MNLSNLKMQTSSKDGVEELVHQHCYLKKMSPSKMRSHPLILLGEILRVHQHHGQLNYPPIAPLVRELVVEGAQHRLKFRAMRWVLAALSITNRVELKGILNSQINSQPRSPGPFHLWDRFQ